MRKRVCIICAYMYIFLLFIYVEDTISLIPHSTLPFWSIFCPILCPPRGGPCIPHYLDSHAGWFPTRIIQLETMEGGWRGGEKFGDVSFLCFGPIYLMVAVLFHTHSSCVQPLLQAPAPSAPTALEMYLRLRFLETHWDGEVNADGLLRKALWIHTCKERKKAGIARRRS